MIDNSPWILDLHPLYRFHIFHFSILRHGSSGAGLAYVFDPLTGLEADVNPDELANNLAIAGIMDAGLDEDEAEGETGGQDAEEERGQKVTELIYVLFDISGSMTQNCFPQQRDTAVDEPPSKSVFIGSLPENVSALELRAVVAVFGPVVHCTVPQSNEIHGFNRGIGFVDFMTLEAARKCVEQLKGSKPFKGQSRVSVNYTNISLIFLKSLYSDNFFLLHNFGGPDNFDNTSQALNAKFGRPREKKVKDNVDKLSKLDMAKQLFGAYANRSMASDHVHKIGLCLFGSDVSIAMELTRMFEGFKQGVDQVVAHGKTRLLDAISIACDRLGAAKEAADSTVLRRIVCLTDGNDEGSNAKFQEVVTKVQRMNVVVDAVMFGTYSNNDLMSLCENSSGLRFVPSSVGEVRRKCTNKYTHAHKHKHTHTHAHTRTHTHTKLGHLGNISRSSTHTTTQQ
jgi:Mg-chelatase subunit ChlD